MSDFGVTDFRTMGNMDYVIKLDVRMGIRHLLFKKYFFIFFMFFN